LKIRLTGKGKAAHLVYRVVPPLSLDDREAVIAELGFDQPVRCRANVLHGEFGISYRLKRPSSRSLPSACPGRWGGR
jgi:ribosomal protein S16